MTTVTLREDFFRPYTMEEVNAMLDRAEADIAAGRVIPHEEVMREIDEEFRRDEERLRLIEEKMRPYTMEEINAMLDRAEADFEAGRGIPSKVVFRHLREDLEKELGNDYIVREAV